MKQKLLGAVKIGPKTTTGSIEQVLSKHKMFKKANYGNPSVNMQSYAPISQKRQLSPQEQQEVMQAKDNWLPKIFASNADPITSKINSPAISTIGGGLLGGGALGAYGAMAGEAMGGHGLAGGLIGGGLGALGGGLLGYFGKRQSNENLEDAMTRLPEGQTTLRDMKADPVHQAEQRNQAERAGGTNNALLLAALMNRK